MRCKTAEHFISLKLDNELKPINAAQLAKHLNTCSSCKAFMEDSRRLQTLLHSVPNPDYPAWMHQRIMRSLPTRKKGLWLFNPASTYAGATLAIAFSLFFGALTGIHGYQESGWSGSTETVQSVQLRFGENSLMEMYDE